VMHYTMHIYNMQTVSHILFIFSLFIVHSMSVNLSELCLV